MLGHTGQVLVKKIHKGKITNFNCLRGPGVEEGTNALQLQGKRVGETKVSTGNESCLPCAVMHIDVED